MRRCDLCGSIMVYVNKESPWEAPVWYCPHCEEQRAKERRVCEECSNHWLKGRRKKMRCVIHKKCKKASDCDEFVAKRLWRDTVY